VGRPNVGKSSLLNAWTRTDRAIVTEIAGTTRDVLEAGLVVGGVPITLLDTAGIRESGDAVEKLGVARSAAAAAAADVVIMVVDAASGWTDADGAIFKGLWGDGPGTRGCTVRGLSMLVLNKADLLTPPGAPSAAAAGAGSAGSAGSAAGGGGGPDAEAALAAAAAAFQLPVVPEETFQRVVATSAVARTGLGALEGALLLLAGAPALASGGASWAVNERQAEALVRSHEALMRVADSAAQGLPIDFWTIDLRSALIALGEVSGDDVTEEVLDSIFSRFCIGK